MKTKVVGLFLIILLASVGATSVQAYTNFSCETSVTNSIRQVLTSAKVTVAIPKQERTFSYIGTSYKYSNWEYANMFIASKISGKSSLSWGCGVQQR